MATHYNRKQPGVAVRMREFFAANPHEELTVPDMMVKFSCSEQTVKGALVDLHGMLERVSVYRVKVTA